MSYLLLHTEQWKPGEIAGALQAARIDTQVVARPADLVKEDRPTVFILDPGARNAFSPDVLRGFVDSGGAVVVLGLNGETDLPEDLPVELLAGYVRHPPQPRHLFLAMRAGFREAAGRIETSRARAEAAQRAREIGDLTRIGVALATERDLKSLLDQILTEARRITQSDGGTLYLVETAETGQKRLRFRLAHTESKPNVPFVEFTMPIDHSSIAGYCASTGEPLVLDDAYFLPPDVEYSINRSFDERYGYRTKSMLVIPMKDHKDQVIGVLQLINRKRDPAAVLESPAEVERFVVPFSRRTVELATALAAQAGVAIENSKLYEDIERLFEGFVTAAVTAIEQRDPTTFGHSGRVASYTVALAEVVDRAGDGAYKSVRFTRQQIREIRYAGLLHDFGKVGVREQVLVKAKKLYPQDLSLIRQRYGFIRRTLERDFWRCRAEKLEKGDQGYDAFLKKLQAEHDAELKELDGFMGTVSQANEPTVLPEGSFEELSRWSQRRYDDHEGRPQPFLTDDEVRFLTIRKGSLDEAERLEIESHVTHTYRFLLQIPWTKELSQIPLIAYGHHEKMDGRGYPRHVAAGEIPIQTRMMTISDIFDALTASDRPYKRAVPMERALDIITQEVKEGQLDQELFRLFIEGKVFERVGSGSGD
jgi:HD-GYP domain-containing protein (c-di-GMP phosphodiesterase class II)